MLRLGAEVHLPRPQERVRRLSLKVESRATGRGGTCPSAWCGAARPDSLMRLDHIYTSPSRPGPLASQSLTLTLDRSFLPMETSVHIHACALCGAANGMSTIGFQIPDLTRHVCQQCLPWELATQQQITILRRSSRLTRRPMALRMKVSYVPPQSHRR